LLMIRVGFVPEKTEDSVIESMREGYGSSGGGKG
jgi:hypothetical protein